jgi:DNA mismatch repair protein MutL
MIRILPSHLINQIAAGEVVERPASVVKELVENAIDAGATSIEVVLRQEGRSFIGVYDNGCGMTAEDLALCIERHATSKLPDENLFNIHSLGFRGEALPSIGSIARLQVSSCRESSDSGWSVSVEGGHKGSLTPASHAKGTRVEVRDLFFATPARLKFLKTATTEKAHIVEALERLALAHPHIAFILKDERRTIMNLRAAVKDEHGLSLERIGAILGHDFMDNALPLEAEREGYKICGHISLPTLNRATAQVQYLFVNGRTVKDKILNGAIRAAYQDVLPHDRHPLVCLFLSVDPLYVDVNVHPSKAEVRFSDSGMVRSLLVGAIKSTLAQNSVRTSSTMSNAALKAMRPEEGGMLSYWPNPYLSPGSQPRYQSFHSAGRSNLAPLLNLRSEIPNQQKEGIAPLNERAHISAPTSELHPLLGWAKAQLHGTYVVAQTVDGMVIVDQHAAHERLVYEQIKQEMQTQKVQRQILLVPEVVKLSPIQTTLLVDQRDYLEEFGLIIEAFGENTILVREAPAVVGEIDIPQLIRDLADEAVEHGQTFSLKESRDKVWATMACHASVRAGRNLTLHEMNQLLRTMETTAHAGQCNHGRPTYIELKLDEIEKLFARR